MNSRAAAPSPTSWLPWAAAVVGLVVPVVMIVAARSGGSFAFPVDDAWIHLVYARNLADHGAFTYFPGDRTTAGSTAPLFTLLEAVAFKVTRDELAIGLGLGLIAHAAFLFALARWALARLGHPGWAALAVALVALDGRFGMLAASGMETSLFLGGLAFAFLAWTRRDALGAGVALGLATWVRPEAIVLAGVFAIDAALARRRPARLVPGLAALAALVAGYALFNQLTGGTAFPNTLAAKAAFYGDRTLATFLREDVAGTLRGAWALVAVLALIDAGAQLARLRRGEREGFSLAEIGWAVALPLAYAVTLPFSHRFHRYLVPMLPALAIAGAAGMRWTVAKLTGRRPARHEKKPKGRSAAPMPAAPAAASGAGAIAVTAALALLAVQGWAFAYAFFEYGAIGRYHAERHVRAGRWLAENTPEDAVIATHDVGAIAFYSQRRIVDMVGLVSPEVVPHLGKPDYLAWLARFLDERRVTHLAVLEEWQPVDNERPLFEASPEPEILHVYPWHPGRTHLLTLEVAERIGALRAAMETADVPLARSIAADVLRRDPRAASAWTLLGILEGRAGNLAAADSAFRRALALFPDSEVAKRGLDAAARR